jgi:hypothetical protein
VVSDRVSTSRIAEVSPKEGSKVSRCYLFLRFVSLNIELLIFQKNRMKGIQFKLLLPSGHLSKSAATSQMEASVVALARELSKLRTGRAPAGIFSLIIYLQFQSVDFVLAESFVFPTV